MIAQRYGQDPRTVAAWDPEWLAAVSTVMAAENGAAAEIQRHNERQAKLRSSRGGR